MGADVVRRVRILLRTYIIYLYYVNIRRDENGTGAIKVYNKSFIPPHSTLSRRTFPSGTSDSLSFFSTRKCNYYIHVSSPLLLTHTHQTRNAQNDIHKFTPYWSSVHPDASHRYNSPASLKNRKQF